MSRGHSLAIVLALLGGFAWGCGPAARNGAADATPIDSTILSQRDSSSPELPSKEGEDASTVATADAATPGSRMSLRETPDAYSVYNVVLASEFKGAPFLVVASRTGFDEQTAGFLKRSVQRHQRAQAEKSLPEEILALKRLLETPESTLERDKFTLPMPVHLLDAGLDDAAFRCVDGGQLGWDCFYERERGNKDINSMGLVTLSPVVYDAGQTLAYVHVSRICGALCGKGLLFRLEKGPGGWRISKRTRIWAS